MDDKKFFVDGDRIYIGTPLYNKMVENENGYNFYTVFKEIILLNNNAEKSKEIKGKLFVDNTDIFNTFEDAKKAVSVFIAAKKLKYISECSSLKGLLNFPLNHIMINGKVDKDAVEVYRVMKNKMLQTIYREEK